MRAAGVLPVGAAAGATAPAAAVPVIVVAPAVSGVADDPVTEAVRSICAKASFEDVAVVAAGVVAAGAAAPPSTEFSSAMRVKTLSRLISSIHRRLDADL